MVRLMAGLVLCNEYNSLMARTCSLRTLLMCNGLSFLNIATLFGSKRKITLKKEKEEALAEFGEGLFHDSMGGGTDGNQTQDGGVTDGEEK